MVHLGAIVLLASALAASAKPHGLRSAKRHHERALERELEERRLLEERLKPITATTTMVTEMTETHTVWVMATGNQHTFAASSQAVSISSAVVSSVDRSSSSSSERPPRMTPSFSSGSTASGVAHTDAVSTSSMAPSPSHSSASGPAQSSPAPHSNSHSAVESSLSSAHANTAAVSTSSMAPSPSHSSQSGAPQSSPAPHSSSHAIVESSLSSALVNTEAVSTSSMAPSPSHSSRSGPAQPSPTPHSSSGSPQPSPPASSRSGPAQPSPTPHSSSGAPQPSPLPSSRSGPAQPSPSSRSGPAQSSPTPHTSAKGSSTSAVINTDAVSSNPHSSSTSKSLSSAHTAMSSSMEQPSSSSAQASSTTQSSSALPSSTNGASLSGTLMNGYYPDWSGWYLAPEDVDFSKFDVIDFAFALPTSDNNLQFTQDDSSDLLKRLVSTGHAAGKKVKLSIGGWTGSQYFSTIVSQDWSTRAFVNNILNAYNEYNLDGIDIDWEYPGTQGAPGNAVSPNDAANFLNFLQILRWTLPSDALISLATQVWPFTGPDGNPLSDVSGFASVIDWILIMNYDIWGSSSTPGANAPLSNGCGNSSQPLANAYSAVASWTAAGMPANQITLGVPAYGYLQDSWATRLQDRRSLPHKQDMASRGYVTVVNDNGGSSDGQVMFESLIAQGALVSDGNGGYEGAGGFFRVWDECSSTPFLKSWNSGQIVTYDDPQSMNLKGQFAAQAGLRGCNVFSIDGDYYQGAWPLTDAVRSGMGLS